MRYFTLLLVAIMAIALQCCRQTTPKVAHTVNPILGDQSYVSKFGRQPEATTSEQERIQTHLAYVEQMLRSKSVAHLSPELQQRRRHLLDLLHAYTICGRFPRNYEMEDQRVPCFIDKDGTICAVGYLIEQTAGRWVAESINAKHQYKALLAMNDATVDTWVAASGLTFEEAAMIQPSYSYYREPD